MRINLNLGKTENPFERYMLVWAVPALVVAALFLARGVYVAERDFLQVRRVEKSVLQYQGQISILQDKANRAQRMLVRPSTRELERKADFLNTLIEQKQVSLSEVTLKMSRLLPDEARLVGLSVVPTKTIPEVQVSVEGKTEDALDTFLDNLEQSPDFSGVIVTSQALKKPGPQGSLVALKCTAHYVGSRTPVISGRMNHHGT
ncbi:MAG: PilN domain-containing protein [Terriglobia bacterium]